MRIVAAALFLVAASAFGETFTLDPKQSELVVKTWKEGLASALAHNHVISATEVFGTLTWDAAAPEKGQVQVTVQVAGLVADRTELRKKHHHEDNVVPPGDQKKVTDAMLGDQQLDLRKFPTIAFTSTAIVKGDQGYVVTGQLTLHGVTKAVKVPAQIVLQDGVVTGDAALKLKVSDYGITPYSTALGTIKVKDEVELVLHLVGKR